MMKKYLMLLCFILIPVMGGSEIWAKSSPSKEPFLRINTPMHIAAISAVSVDAQEKLLLTCSDDKTAILWDAKTGEYLKTLRPPIDDGREGKLYACALSPDGRTALVGGYSGFDWDGKCHIYIFDTATGELTGEIGGIDEVIVNIEYAPGGKYIACSLCGPNGIRIIDASTWQVIKRLDGYGNNCYGISFSQDGQLVTTSWDGMIRLYDQEFKLKKKIKAPGGPYPMGIAYSPDDQKIAVGYADNKVQVLDAKSLQRRYEPDNNGIPAHNWLSEIAWSKDGEFLYAGDFITTKNGVDYKVIRRYADGGKGKFTDLFAGLNTIEDIKALSDGSLIVATSEPELARFDANLNRTFYQASENLIFTRRDGVQYFSTNNSGNIVTFRPLYQDRTYQFDLTKKELSEAKAVYDLSSAKNRGVNVTDWDSNYYPKINRTQITFLKQYELCRCVTVASSGAFVVFGADNHIYLSDPSGKLIWKQPAPGVVLEVNVTRDENLVIACFSDGSIRWYRALDGRELLALFINRDLKRWVLWTPQGYYDCSAGADNLIGWHINNGTERTADFFPASRLAGRFYRPDIINLVLAEHDEDRAIANANAKKNIKTVKTVTESLPPVVTIISPENRAETTTGSINLTVKFKTPNNDPIIEYKTLINGRGADSTRGIKIVSTDGESKTLTVNLSERETLISVIARNSSGWSEPDSVTVIYKTKGEAADDKTDFVIKPNLYILAIGVSKYQNSDYILGYPAKDATDFANSFLKQKGKLYRDVTCRVLTDDQAGKDKILDGLEWIQKATTAKDVAMIFIAGHGMNDNNGRLYYLPYEADVEKMRSTCLPAEEIAAAIQDIAGKVIYFMDTCHSGNIQVVGRRGLDIDINGAVNELISAENGAVVFCSSSGRQSSLEKDEWQNGAFTKALVQGLSGQADYNRDGIVSINELDLFVSEEVKKMTGGEQTPVTAKPDTIRDFPIAAE